jgi:hypothetical protein
VGSLPDTIAAKTIFDVQDEITLAVLDALKVKLPGAEKSTVLKRQTENAAAHELYLKGRFHLFRMTDAGIEAGVRATAGRSGAQSRGRSPQSGGD